ncbi:MAG: hypothetical protein WBD59_10625, partial [Candidatus Sulfotelmatobacter sp.]
MNNFFRCRLQAYVLVLLLSIFPALLASASDEPAPKPTDVPAQVIAHLPLPQPTGSQMTLQKEHGKQYLYVQQASRPGYMVIDVSHPDATAL